MSRIDRTSRRAAAGLALAAAAALAAACGSSAAAERPPSAPEVVLAAGDVGTVAERRLQDGPILSGALDAADRAVVRAEIAGAVVATLADEGSAVAAGAVLARLDDRTQRAAHASALAAVRAAASGHAAAERRAARVDMLLAGGAVSAEEAEETRQRVAGAAAELEGARARLADAAAQLGRATVRSPIAGVVRSRAVSAGEAVQPGAPLFEVLDPSTMRLEAAVPAARLGGLRVGAEVRFSVTGYPGRVFAGRIARVGPAADAATRQVPVVVTIANRDRRLVAGLFAEGRVVADGRRALVVPAAAVDGGGGRPTVLRLSAGRLVQVPVEAGARDAERGEVEIVAGLARGDTVLLGAAQGIRPGSAARVAAPNARPSTSH